MGFSKEKRAERFKKGLCSDCPNPRFLNTTLCEKCREHRSAYHTNRFKTDSDFRERMLENSTRWQKENPQRTREISSKSKQSRHLACKLEAIAHYGGECACCGESNYQFLTLDHSLGNGKKHREELLGDGRAAGSAFTFKLKSLGFPEVEGLRVMCFNCHFATDLWGGCPHNEKALIAGTTGEFDR